MKNILFLAIMAVGQLFSLEKVCCQSLAILSRSTFIGQKADVQSVGSRIESNPSRKMLSQPSNFSATVNSFYGPCFCKAPTLLNTTTANKILFDKYSFDSLTKGFVFPNWGVGNINTSTINFLEKTALNNKGIDYAFREAHELERLQIILYLDLWGQAQLTLDEIDLGNNVVEGTQIIGVDRSLYDYTDIGIHKIGLRLQDKYGSKFTARAQLTVRDTLAPIMITQDITVALDEWGQASIGPADIDFGSNDGCGIESLELDKNTFYRTDLGLQRVKLSAMDINGNWASAFALVKVIDTLAPKRLYMNTRDGIVLHTHSQPSKLFQESMASPQKKTIVSGGLSFAEDYLVDEILIEVYPNPFSNSFNIRCSGTLENKSVTCSLMDVSGREILTRSFNPEFQKEITIDADDYFIIQGIYFLNITDGITSSICKLIKK